jgi:hypothetical protein
MAGDGRLLYTGAKIGFRSNNQKEVNQMSRKAVEAIIGKAVLDMEFREALFADPDNTLEGYDLTEEEVAGLKVIDSETMESLAGTLDERISKFGSHLVFWGGFEIQHGYAMPAVEKGVVRPV